MCILAFISNYSARLPFVLISNRDEFLNRQTLELSWKYFSNHILCALDVSAGGTWMGLEREHGRFAIITNCRRPPAAALTPFRQEPLSQLLEIHANDKYNVQPLPQENHFIKEENVKEETSNCDSNCTRSDRCFNSRNSKDWRGAAPLLEILKNTKVKSFVNQERGNRLERILSYEPVISRGSIVKDYLLHGMLPSSSLNLAEWLEKSLLVEHEFAQGRECNSEKEISCENFTFPSPSLCPPYYAGYNLLTCPSLLGKTEEFRVNTNVSNTEENNDNKQSNTCTNDETKSQSPFALHYTTNRYGAEYNELLSDGPIHCLQNSYIDNWAEPKCTELRRLFKRTLENDISPLLNDADAQSSVSLSDETVLSVASLLADNCLNATPEFNLCEMMNNTTTSNTRRNELYNILHSNDPLNGFTAEELIQWWGEGAPFTNGNASKIENELQRNIFTREKQGYATRVQSVVFVEVLQEGNKHSYQNTSEKEFTEQYQTERNVTAQQSGKAQERKEKTVYMVHFMQRATPAENAQDTSWKHFKLRSDEEAINR